MNINLRENITRTLTYSKVIITVNTFYHTFYNVYGVTDEKKELIKYLRNNPNGDIPTIKVNTVTERRTMSLDNFLNNSIIINESEEK